MASLYQSSDKIPVDLKHFIEIAEHNQKHRLVNLDNAAEQQRLSAEAEIKHKIDLNAVKLEDLRGINRLRHQAVLQVLEKELVLAYSKAQISERTETIEKLGEMMEKALNGGKDAIQELRILASPDGNLVAAISEGLREVLKLLFSAPPVAEELKSALSEVWRDPVTSDFAHGRSDCCSEKTDDAGTPQSDVSESDIKNSTDYPV